MGQKLGHKKAPKRSRKRGANKVRGVLCQWQKWVPARKVGLIIGVTRCPSFSPLLIPCFTTRVVDVSEFTNLAIEAELAVLKANSGKTRKVDRPEIQEG